MRPNRQSPPLRGSARIATSHWITTCATFAALILFVVLGSQVMPGAIGFGQPAKALGTALILNIAIILFGWRRSKDLSETMQALGRAESEAFENAFTDHATGLANRRALVTELEAALDRPNPKGVMVLFDLDHFKKINDLYGHSAGDQLLEHVGGVLRQIMPADSCIARLGGDEFAVLLVKASEPEAERLVSGVLEALAVPVPLANSRAHVSASAGIAMLAASLKPGDMLRRADIAMYSAKRSGRNTLAWFHAELEEQLQSRAALEEEIRQGIEADEFVPFFQPLISLDTGILNGFEVLARWKSPRRGLVEPADFIAAAEASGLIDALSMSVMGKALREARDWPAHLKIAVNISPVQFRDPHLAERVLKLLTETGFPARRLELEITEGSLLEDREQAATLIRSLKNNGVSIALDDFGTGYASLTQLQLIPFDRIKIDKSFVAALDQDGQSAAIVRTIVSLGKSLSLPVTAEGVESESIRAQLATLGCSDAQGWLFGRAVAAQFIRGQFASQDSGSEESPADVCGPLDASRSDPAQLRRASSRKW